MWTNPDALYTINAQHMRELAEDAVEIRLARRAIRAHRRNGEDQPCIVPTAR